MTSGIHISELVRIIYAFGNKRAKSLFSSINNSRISQLAERFRVSGRRDESAWAREIEDSEPSSQDYVRLRSLLKQRLIECDTDSKVTAPDDATRQSQSVLEHN